MSQNFNRIQNSIINIHNCHRERSPTPDSSRSTVSEPKIKRRKKLTYLVGQGSKEWEPSCPLVIKDVDVTKVLKRFRDQNVKSADDGHLLGDVRVLSLSHVFPLADYADDKCVLNYLKDDEKEALKQCRSSLFYQKMNEVSDEAVLFCHKASKSKESVLQPKNNYDEVIADICRQMIKGRAAFINLHLMEFVNKILIDNESKTTSHVM
ncbi:hypothetical protein A0J61_10645 [Choanephora cucurbitarum]|uniref:Uncharacterized protein n=1 Tax=Choanephora cucurbitarum TaxID=101091 RepID=A0A1C7MWV0_9FUNG|nr:hypothetical protein A0J61_10645 [Choanephora cucurbitarum]